MSVHLPINYEHNISVFHKVMGFH